MAKKKKEKGTEEKDVAEEATEEKEEAAKGEEGAEGTEGGEGAEGGARKGKRKLIIIVGAAVAVLLLIVGGLFATGVIGGKKEVAPATPQIAKPVYYELPEFLVNLSNPGSGTRVTFLKMSVTLELRDQAAVAILDANKPRIIDVFNTYLRELRAADIQGSAGIYRLRDELLTRINGTVQEGVVKDILFSEIIVQ